MNNYSISLHFSVGKSVSLYRRYISWKGNFTLVGCFFFFALAKAQSPSITPTQQISIQHDNDFLFAIDRYYTTGTFLGYSKTLQGDLIFKNTDSHSLQLDLKLGQETYTPRELFETDFEFLERPYAGYLFTRAGVTSASNGCLWQLSAEVGLAGPQSLAGEAQVAYHRLINEFIPSWSGEIANSFHVNGYGAYIKSFQKDKRAFFDVQSKVALGTRQIFLEQEATLFVGRRSSIARSAHYNRIGVEKELYGYAGVYYRFVGLNALIQGHPWGDDSPFTLPIINSLLGAQMGMVFRKNRNTFQIEYVNQSRETSREGRLHYASFIFKRAF